MNAILDPVLCGKHKVLVCNFFSCVGNATLILKLKQGKAGQFLTQQCRCHASVDLCNARAQFRKHLCAYFCVPPVATASSSL